MAKVKASDFLRAIQGRTARIAASASASRGQGPGVTQAARMFFGDLDLRKFRVKNAAVFRKRLNMETGKLVRSLPSGARNWGLARKLLNIFLRDALYTTYLRDRFQLGAAEEFLEIPLDSITAGYLRKDAGRGVLPLWTGVKHLTPTTNGLYQRQAAELARERGLARVHLDTFWWGERAG